MNRSFFIKTGCMAGVGFLMAPLAMAFKHGKPSLMIIAGGGIPSSAFTLRNGSFYALAQWFGQPKQLGYKENLHLTDSHLDIAEQLIYNFQNAFSGNCTLISANKALLNTPLVAGGMTTITPALIHTGAPNQSDKSVIQTAMDWVLKSQPGNLIIHLEDADKAHYSESDYHEVLLANNRELQKFIPLCLKSQLFNEILLCTDFGRGEFEEGMSHHRKEHLQDFILFQRKAAEWSIT